MIQMRDGVWQANQVIASNTVAYVVIQLSGQK